MDAEFKFSDLNRKNLKTKTKEVIMNLNSNNQTYTEGEEDYYEQDMEDYKDVQLFSKIYVGSEKQPFDVIFDTGSAWTWVQGHDCHTCPTYDRFNPKTSTTFRKLSSWPEYI